MNNLYHKILDEHGGKIGLILCAGSGAVTTIITIVGIAYLF